jgi:hypothetical protein
MQIMSIGSAGIASVSSLSGGQSLSGDTAQISQAVNSAMNGDMSLNQDNLGISKEDFIMILSLSSGDGDDKKHSSSIATLAIEMYLAGNALQAMNDMNSLSGGPAASAGGVAGVSGIGGGGMGGMAAGMGGGMGGGGAI